MPKRERNNKPQVFREKPVFVYISKCCNAPATKPPAVHYRSLEDAKDGTLGGSWKCTQCRKPCTCNRTKNPELLENQKQESLV